MSLALEKGRAVSSDGISDTVVTFRYFLEILYIYSFKLNLCCSQTTLSVASSRAFHL